MNKTVIVAMSGGVDSSVAALLLKEAGYQVIGVTMQIWPQQEDQAKACCSLEAVSDAQRVAWKIGIPHYVMNFRKEFEEKVIREFCDEYLGGRTPNPCISCNRFIKFDLLLKKAQALRADYIATGHYVRREFDQASGKYVLKTGLDFTKDQSYALYPMTQAQLKHTLFPLGDCRKAEIRVLAKEKGLVVAEKPESQEICFVEGSYADFVESYRNISASPGDFIDAQGKKIGRHLGIYRYTVGQHKGLGLALGHPVYVTAIDPSNNTVQVGAKEELYRSTLTAENYSFTSGELPPSPSRVTAKIRYNGPKVPAQMYVLDDKKVKVRFDEPVRAITPGQAVVFYREDIVVGGATICSSEK
ncbi:MAG: tRNA-specific 2-thiouridylase MnmA [Candidatus Dichloromethanomonas elyunquensis]|nr:MAG: tRNA-specific 2-thiouridylase MnmA [Candidatus Dichloromethanomonas elyunquensis]